MELIFNYLNIFVKEMWSLCVEMAPYILLGMLVSGIISVFINSDMIFKHIGPKDFTSTLKSTLFGVPLPLCSCGVIPVAATLRESGASKGSTVSFLVSTPQTGVDSVFLTYGMLGPVFALFRPIAAFASGILSGVVINNFDEDEHHHIRKEDLEKNNKLQIKDKIISGFKYGFISLPADIVVPLFKGLLVAAAISIFLPPDYIANHFTSNIYVQFFTMLIISIPFYVCATASIPVAVALMAKGISPGAAFIFLMAGPATNASSIAVIKNILGAKTLYLYLALISFSAIFFGFIFDLFFIETAFTIPDMLHHHNHGSGIDTLLGFVFILTLINAYVSRFKGNEHVNHSNDVLLNESFSQKQIIVDGMTCGHCKESVESVLNAFESVKKASVDLISGKVLIEGVDIEIDEIKEKITSRGFSVR
tara:strand:+ start:195 stop:1457 length:1263 start_codon:yes stop_codon:yes gene_type:complete